MCTWRMERESCRRNPRIGSAPSSVGAAAPFKSRSTSSFIVTLGGTLFMAFEPPRPPRPWRQLGWVNNLEDTLRLLYFYRKSGTSPSTIKFDRNVQTLGEQA